jgi:hypothetical protein
MLPKPLQSKSGALRRRIRGTLAIAMFSAAALAHADSLRDFSSDGCSLFPDGDFENRTLWCDCCLEHDIAYWRGGTARQRLEADASLRACVRNRTGNDALADMMFAGVRLGGGPVFPNGYRWGYGWSYGRGYRPLSPAEEETATSLLNQYRAGGKRFACER